MEHTLTTVTLAAGVTWPMEGPAGCVRCARGVKQVSFLWDVFGELYCNPCHQDTFACYSGRGVFSARGPPQGVGWNVINDHLV